MKNKLIICLCASVIILFTSCATTHVAKKQSPNQTKVELYFAEKPSKQFKEVAFLEADGSIFHSPEKLLRKLEKRAEEERYDAIISIRFDSKFWWPTVSGIGIKYE